MNTPLRVPRTALRVRGSCLDLWGGGGVIEGSFHIQLQTVFFYF